MIHTPSDVVLVKGSLDPESRTASANGKGVNCQNFNRLLAIFHAGAHDRTTGDETLSVKLQESSDDGAGDAYADIPGAVFATLAAQSIDATAGIVFLLNLDLSKREKWIRAVGTSAGTTPITLYGVSFVLFNGRVLPASQDNTPVSA